MATYANLFIDQGSDFSTVISLEDPSSDPFELDNVVFSGQIRRTFQSETAFDFVISIVDANLGEILVSLPKSTTSQMKGGRYVYDIFAQNTEPGNEFKIKVLEGIVEVVPQVTRINE
jgi:hypothetical protein